MWIHIIFWHICNYYEFTKPINSKRCSICYCLAVIWMGSFGDPQFWGLGRAGEIYGVEGCANRKQPHDLVMPLNAKLCSICRRLTGVPMSNYGPPFGWLWWTYGSKMVPIEMSTPHSFLTSTHTVDKFEHAFDTALNFMQTKSSDAAFSVVFRNSINVDRKQLVRRGRLPTISA